MLCSTDRGVSWTSAHPTPAPISLVDVGPDGTVLAFVLGTGLIAVAHSVAAEKQAGRDLYIARCAASLGAELQGQPDWRSPDEYGLYPAPPHDETGHTWHHDDAMLIDYITRGGQAVLDDRNVASTSGMPGFGAVLEASEIEAILDYLKSTWPERIRRIQAERSRAGPAE